MPISRHRRRGTVVVLSVAALAAVSACGSSKKSSTPTTTPTSGGAATTSSVFGAANKATGTPITIGLIGDGTTAAVDGKSSTDAAQATFDYANDYLGGINGHVIKTDLCITKSTPTGGTACGVQMVKDNVAVVVDPVSGVDAAVTAALGDKIPYVTAETATGAVLAGTNKYVLENPVALIAASAAIAKENNASKVAMFVIDVPAATGPITAIAKPLFAALGVGLDLVPVSPTVADMTPQIQQAISGGAKMFSITGTEGFDATAIKGIKAVGFKGPIQVGLSKPAATTVASIPGGFAGVIDVSNQTSDPTDPDVKLINAVMKQYAPSTKVDTSAQVGFAGALGLVRALTGVTTAVDASTISAALGAMPKALPLPLGAGSTFQCGAKLAAQTPAVCTATALESVMSADGSSHDYKPVG